MCNFSIELIILKVKIGKNWIVIVGIYRFLFILLFIWMNEFLVIFEVIFMLINIVFYVGDFNVDFLVLDKIFKVGCKLLDLLDIYDFYCLINKVIRKIKILEIFFDLILINNKRIILILGVVDIFLSDYFLVYIVLCLLVL